MKPKLYQSRDTCQELGSPTQRVTDQSRAHHFSQLSLQPSRCLYTTALPGSTSAEKRSSSVRSYAIGRPPGKTRGTERQYIGSLILYTWVDGAKFWPDWANSFYRKASKTGRHDNVEDEWVLFNPWGADILEPLHLHTSLDSLYLQRATFSVKKATRKLDESAG